jgi:uncharacterized membrane protein
MLYKTLYKNIYNIIPPRCLHRRVFRQRFLHRVFLHFLTHRLVILLPPATATPLALLAAFCLDEIFFKFIFI